MKAAVEDRRAGADEPRLADEPGLWGGRPVLPLSTLWLARRRLLNGWRLLLAVGLGMLVAVTLIGVVPLYTDLQADELAIAGLIATLLVALTLALLLAARYARRVELVMTLHRSED